MNVMAASKYDPISNLLKILEEWKEVLHDLNQIRWFRRDERKNSHISFQQITFEWLSVAARSFFYDFPSKACEFLRIQENRKYFRRALCA